MTMKEEKTECIPAVYVIGKMKGQIIASRPVGRFKARKELIKRDGPPPFPDAVCRHLCENDSMARNGFVCIAHTVWGTTKENLDDRPAEKRKIGGKISASVERTCPYCGSTIRGASYFRWHGDRCKQAPTSVL
jgi:hypothetical protein